MDELKALEIDSMWIDSDLGKLYKCYAAEDINGASLIEEKMFSDGYIDPSMMPKELSNNIIPIIGSPEELDAYLKHLDELDYDLCGIFLHSLLYDYLFNALENG